VLASTRVPVQRRSAMNTAAEARNAKQDPTRRSLPSNQQAQRLWDMYEKKVEGQSKP